MENRILWGAKLYFLHIMCYTIYNYTFVAVQAMGKEGTGMTDGKFHLKSPFSPTGDQPEAIEAICRGLDAGMRYQTLLGVTGSGKTFTMANVIERMNRPTLILEPNKTLAAQLCSEMREFFPDAAVEFFVSYYDYYQPEAYIPGKDMYIEKDASINDEIDRLRHSATASLLERRDVIIVASVSCIYSLGDPVRAQRPEFCTHQVPRAWRYRGHLSHGRSCRYRGARGVFR